MNTYTIIGATSDTGSLIAKNLERRGHSVRKVSRTHGVSIDDENALLHAFEGADGAYVMIPFDMTAPDLHQRETEVAQKLTDAIRRSGVSRVIFLSGLSAKLKKGSSLGAAIMEDLLDGAGIKELIHLRCAFFMENFLKGLSFPAQAQTGVFSMPFRPDRPLSLIACRDIAEVAVELLTSALPLQSGAKELLGAADYTLEEATRIMSEAIGKPGITYHQATLEEGFAGMVSLGVSGSFAAAVMETAQSFNAGERWGSESRSAVNTTGTTLEAWAAEALAGYK